MDVSLKYNLDIVTIFVLILIFIVLRGKQKANILLYKIYNSVLISTFFTSVVNLLLAEFTANEDVYGSQIVLFTGSVYNLMLIGLPILVTIYVLCLAEINYNMDVIWKINVLWPLGVIIVITLCNIITQQAEGALYHHIKMMTSIVFSLYYVVIWISVLFKYRKILEKRKSFCIRLLVVCHTVALVIFYITEVSEIFTFEVALLLIVMLYEIQSPDEYFDKSDAMLQKYLMDGVKVDMSRDRAFSVLFIRIHDVEVKYDSFGDVNTEKLLSKMVSYLRESNKSAVVYRVDKRTFALKLARIDDNALDKMLGEIRKRIREEFRFGDITSVFSISTVFVAFPADIKREDSFEDVVSFIRHVVIPIGDDLTYTELLQNDKETEILEAVKKAVENNGFKVYYQPIYSTKKKSIVAAEALIRLFDDKLGFISPEEFIPLAEREGYILSIGEFVFTDVCRFYSENKLQNMGIDYIEVNLSAVQCMQYKLADEFVEIMHRYGLNSSQINFEITETSAIARSNAMELNINYFVDHGVDLSLDDYGTGYSNISYLYNMPFAFMKIDKSILWSSDKNDKANITLNNIFKMAKNLKMRIVVEGVETEDHIKKLLKLDCDYFQGYYFSKPVCENDFIKYINEFKVPEICMV